MACEGYFDKIEDEAHLQRFASFRLHQSLVSKPLSMEKFWPLRSDKKEAAFKPMSKEEWDLMMVRQKRIDDHIKKQIINN